MNLPTSKLRGYSNKGPQAGQAIAMIHLVLLLALGLGQAGCTSTYHRARNHLPPTPAEELKLRLREAASAEARVDLAAGELLKNLSGRITPPSIERDFDRLEVAAFELERRILAARDLSARAVAPPAPADEMERLSQKAARSLALVASENRTTPVSNLVAQLEALLQ